MTDVINTLKKNGKCTEELEKVLLQRFSGFQLELFKKEAQNNDHRRRDFDIQIK